jgi:DNA-binding transcriptional regulator YiaG
MMTAEDIRREREKLGLTQGELAKLLGVALNTVSRWEIGTRTPHPVVLKAIQTVFAEVRDRRAKARHRRDSR